MNNVAGTVPVPLSVFGGAVTEMSPEDLPEGASPFNQDCDYVPGGVFSRAGRQSVYTFGGLFVDDLAGFAASVPGPRAPNEAPWISPLNSTLNIPGTYASITLNAPVGGSAGGTLDSVVTNSGNSASATASGTPTRAGEVAFLIEADTGKTPGAPVPGGWTLLDNPNGASDGTFYVKFLPSGSSVSETQTLGGGAGLWATMLAFFGSSTGIAPTMPQVRNSIISGGFGTGPFSNAFVSPITTGSGILVLIVTNSTTTPPTCTIVSDNRGNVYTKIGQVTSGNGGGIAAFWAPNAAALATTVTVSMSAFFGACEIVAYEIAGIGSLGATPCASPIVRASHLGFDIPSTQSVLGAQVEISGHQSGSSADEVLSVNLLKADGSSGATILTTQLPLIDGQVTVGTTLETWSLVLNQALVNNPNFGVEIVASASALATFSIYAVKLKIWLTPNPAPSFNYLKTFAETGGEVLTLALGSDGTIYQEDVGNLPGTLTAVYSAIKPYSLAQL